MDVTLTQMLAAREARAAEQRRLLALHRRPILCFTMNIPGPVKDTPLIRRGFDVGLAALSARLPKSRVLHAAAVRGVTGCEALYAVDMDAAALKAIAVGIEDANPLGRLFDMDVLDVDGAKLDRQLVGGASRDCIVCGAPGRGCASRRSHGIPELQAAARRILAQHFRRQDAETLGAWAVQSLLEEAVTTPKPGLVDRRNSGSHRDMDLLTFLASAAALGPYLTRCAAIGQDTAELAPEETFRRLRQPGMEAEQAMYAATGGVNTHKGAIFTMGILCGAAGRLWKPEGGWDEDALFGEVAAMTAADMAQALSRRAEDTAGERLYARLGVRGIRGEVANGLPSVRTLGLPTFRQGLARGLSREEAGAAALLRLIAEVEDTNMLARGGPALAREGARRAAALLKAGPTRRTLEALDDWFIENNLSPGGCADLLAAVYFVDHLKGL